MPTGPSFTDWLRAHQDDDTPLGDIARDTVAVDPSFPSEAVSWAEVVRYLDRSHASGDFIDSTFDAMTAWARETGHPIPRPDDDSVPPWLRSAVTRM